MATDPTKTTETHSVKTILRDTGNVVLLALGDREYTLSPSEASQLASRLSSEAFFASENQALRRSWMKCRDALEAVQSEILLDGQIAEIVEDALS